VLLFDLDAKKPSVAQQTSNQPPPGSNRPVPAVNDHTAAGVQGGDTNNGGPGGCRQPSVISPQQQKQVDRLTWQDLDADFCQQNQRQQQKTTSKEAREGTSGLDDSSSDFESPLLLKRSLPQITSLNSAVPPAQQKPVVSATRQAADSGSPDEIAIEDFGSPPLYPEPGKRDGEIKSANDKVITAKESTAGEKKKKVARQKPAENRWGLQVPYAKVLA
jgi:hypothetical protein